MEESRETGRKDILKEIAIGLLFLIFYGALLAGAPSPLYFYLVAFFTLFSYLVYKKSAYIEEEEKKKAIPDLNLALIGLISVIMNADGQATKSELTEVKSFLLERFGEQKAKKMLLYLKQSLQKEITNFRPHCLRLNRSLSYSQKLDFLTLLFRIADANNGICQNEAEILSRIARHTAISNSDFIELTHQFSTFYNYQKRQTQLLVYHDTRWAYKILLIEENASVEEIKKAYRKLAMQYHPDRIDSNDTMAQAQAAEKFRDINEAYKYLKKEKRR